MQGCKKGFTILEVTIVIVIIALVALPISMLLSQIFKNNNYNSLDIECQKAMNLIMQDIEKRIRRADNGSITFDTATKKLQFSYVDAYNPSVPEYEDQGGYKKDTLYCIYQLENAQTPQSIFERNIGTGLSPFPVGLENGIIWDFSVDVSDAPPYTVTIIITPSIESYNPSNPSNPSEPNPPLRTPLTKTIYLINYNQ